MLSGRGQYQVIFNIALYCHIRSIKFAFNWAMPRPIGIPRHREVTNIWEALGAVVRDLRVKKGFSQATLADNLGCGVSYISKLERGKMNPSQTRLFDIADALGVEVGYLSNKAKRTFEKSRVSAQGTKPKTKGRRRSE
jgi:ribosome-binding protein aMBF1 (putative translation factor)